MGKNLSYDPFFQCKHHSWWYLQVFEWKPAAINFDLSHKKQAWHIHSFSSFHDLIGFQKYSSRIFIDDLHLSFYLCKGLGQGNYRTDYQTINGSWKNHFWILKNVKLFLERKMEQTNNWTNKALVHILQGSLNGIGIINCFWGLKKIYRIIGGAASSIGFFFQGWINSNLFLTQFLVFSL